LPLLLRSPSLRPFRHPHTCSERARSLLLLFAVQVWSELLLLLRLLVIRISSTLATSPGLLQLEVNIRSPHLFLNDAHDFFSSTASRALISLCTPPSHSLCVFLFSFTFLGLFFSDNNKLLQNSIAVVLVPASVQGNREIMTPQRRESRVLSSGWKETEALGGRNLHAAVAAQSPRRSIHNTTPHSSSRRSTQAFTELGPRQCAGIVHSIPAAAPAAPPPRRSTHKFIHFYQNTSLYGAWQK
jgi:hypothetical protein